MIRCTQLLTVDWLARLSQFQTLLIGFSGGLDSTVLLHALASSPVLHPKLVAMHINHGISSHAASWQAHCELQCQSYNIPFISKSIQFDRSANIEERARAARYTAFSSQLTQEDCLILGHHRDDQAETVLLQLFRGTGIDGLAAMKELSPLDSGTVARPLLVYSRAQLEQYAVFHQLSWIDDESNQEIHYSRNYLRHQILPLLAEKWPGVAGNIARTATHCQQAKVNLEALAISDYQALISTKNTLDIESLYHLNEERIANLLRIWLKKNQIKSPSTATFTRLIHEVIFARSDAAPEVKWGGTVVRRYQKNLYLDKLQKNDLPDCIEWSTFPLPLTLVESGISFTAEKIEQGIIVPEKAKIEIKFRQGGEKFFWHGQTKQLKKLFQEWEIPPWLRDQVPLLYINEELAAVLGYAVSDSFFNKNSCSAWHISF